MAHNENFGEVNKSLSHSYWFSLFKNKKGNRKTGSHDTTWFEKSHVLLVQTNQVRFCWERFHIKPTRVYSERQFV